MEEYGRIYCITNILTGLKYIGQTTKTIEERFKRHIHDSEKKADYYFHRAISKYGSENFEVKKLATAYSLEELNTLEKQYIEEYNTKVPNGYNIRDGGEQYSVENRTKGIQEFYDELKKDPVKYEEYIEERRELMRIVALRYNIKEKNIGKKHPHLEETKKQISKTLKEKGHKPSVDCYEKARVARLGSKHSEESKQKISEHRKGIHAYNRYIPTEEELLKIKELRSKGLGLRKIAIEVFGSENNKCKTTRIVKEYNL